MSKTRYSAEQRNIARAIVRRANGFQAWRVANGDFASRDLTGDLLHRAIAELGLGDSVAAAIEGNVPVETFNALLEAVAADARADAGEAEKVWLAGPAGTGMATAPDAAAGMAELAENVLSPLRPFLSPALLDTVDKALQPIIVAALKPAVEIERIVEKPVERVVTVDSNGAPIVPAFVPAQRVGMSTLGKLFGISARAKHADKPISLWDAAVPDAPPVDPFFVPDVANLAKLVTAIDPAVSRKPGNVWLAGPAGGGKSTLPEQIAARAQRPFVAITFQRAVEPADIIGGNGLSNGATKWVDGVLTRAIRRPGTIILLDEITFAPPGIAAMLQTLLSSRYMTLPTGEVVHCADGVAFVCADNTRGYGDESGLYAGTHMANAALVDRMARLIVVDYLSPALETSALVNHTGAPVAACERVVSFIGTARKLAGFEAVPLSLRRQVAFVKMALDGFTLDECFEDTISSRLPDAERETIRAHFVSDFKKDMFTAELFNKPIPAAPSSDPAQARARGVFDSVEIE